MNVNGFFDVATEPPGLTRLLDFTSQPTCFPVSYHEVQIDLQTSRTNPTGHFHSQYRLTVTKDGIVGPGHRLAHEVNGFFDDKMLYA